MNYYENDTKYPGMEIKVFKFGLKLWSNNKNYVKEAVALYEKGIYQYIELYVLPGIDDAQLSMWKDLNIPYVIHAPHFRDGLNLAKKELKENNLLLIKKTQKIADVLKSDKIIVHPGIAGEIEETVRQLKEINEPRILIENKPYYALYDGLICNGATIEEIKFIMDNTQVGFCLDIGHAFCAANALKKEPNEYMREFLRFKPEVFHLTDGDYNGIYDRHDHFGKGNYTIMDIIAILPSNSYITVETIKDFHDSLSDFEKDMITLKEII